MKKLLIGTSALVAGTVLATAFVALAQTASSMPPTPPTHAMTMVLQVGPAGRVLLRGTIDTISSGSLTVKSWGGDWTVNVGAGAQVLPAAAGNDLAQFKTGDYVGVQGTVSQSASWTIDATLVRDWTYRQMVNQEQHQNQQAARQLMQGETPRNYQGSASGVSGSSFTLTVGNGTAYTVNAAANAQIVNRNWLTIALSAIQNGDTVRVWGTNSSGTITAQIVRDTTVPAAGTAH